MALNASSCVEVRSTGADTNGGGCRGNGLTPAPSAPAVSNAGAGGTVAAGTYFIIIVYGNAIGEGPKSVETSTTTSGTTSTITVTSPAASTYATSWSWYAATASGGPYFQVATGIAIGTNSTRTTTPPTTGTQPIGVDRSQQNAAQVNIDNATIIVTNTGATITFVSGYTPSANDVGNWLQTLSGVGVTLGWYEIIAWTATTWTLDRTDNAAGVAMTGKMGGGLATVNQGVAAMVGGNTLWVKKATYTTATAISLPAGATNATAAIGYNATRGDFDTTNRPTIQASAGLAGAGILGGLNSVQIIDNFIVDCNSKASTRGVYFNDGNSQTIRRVKVINTLDYGIVLYFCRGSLIQFCEVVGSSGIGSFYVYGGNSIQFCSARGGTSSNVGFQFVPESSLRGSVNVLGCIAYGQTGASADGFFVDPVGNAAVNFVNCVAYNCGRDGFRLLGSTPYGSTFVNCIAESNAGVGFNSGFAANNSVSMLTCAAYNNTGGNIGGTTRVPDLNGAGVSGTPNFQDILVYTASAFTNAAGADFSLNNNTPGGAQLRATGFPGALPSGGAGYADIGALQHQSATAVQGKGVPNIPGIRID